MRQLFYGLAAALVLLIAGPTAAHASLTPSPPLAVPGVTLPKSPPVWRRPRIIRRDTFSIVPARKLETNERPATRPQASDPVGGGRKYRRPDHSANRLNRQELRRLRSRPAHPQLVHPFPR